MTRSDRWVRRGEVGGKSEAFLQLGLVDVDRTNGPFTTLLEGKVKTHSPGAGGRAARARRSVVSFFATLAVIASSALAITVTAIPASAETTGTGVSYTKAGCRNDGTIVLPIGGQFICPDGDYTPGNLGPGWNELDLVPYRVTVKAGNSAPDSQSLRLCHRRRQPGRRQARL